MAVNAAATVGQLNDWPPQLEECASDTALQVIPLTKALAAWPSTAADDGESVTLTRLRMTIESKADNEPAPSGTNG
jgi:hypothetical protein